MSNQPANGHKKLNFSDCMGMAVGQIIGSGIMVLTGIVIGLTGHGTPHAFIMGALLAIATCIPFIILTSTIPASSAGYTYPHRQERRPQGKGAYRLSVPRRLTSFSADVP